MRRLVTCPNCGYELPDDLVQRRRALGKASITCPACDEREMSLADESLPTSAVTAVDEMNRSANLMRDRLVAATQIRGKREASDFDVFLCYNSADRAEVTAIAGRLKEQGILPWLDVWEIPPGTRWQTELNKILRSVRSAAVFLGPRGPGPWQEMEVEELLQKLRRRRPIIPVILPLRKGTPRLPPFLSSFHLVDMRNPVPDPFEQLIWGITRQKPS